MALVTVTALCGAFALLIVIVLSNIVVERSVAAAAFLPKAEDSATPDEIAFAISAAAAPGATDGREFDPRMVASSARLCRTQNVPCYNDDTCAVLCSDYAILPSVCVRNLCVLSSEVGGGSGEEGEKALRSKGLSASEIKRWTAFAFARMNGGSVDQQYDPYGSKPPGFGDPEPSDTNCDTRNGEFAILTGVEGIGVARWVCVNLYGAFADRSTFCEGGEWTPDARVKAPNYSDCDCGEGKKRVVYSFREASTDFVPHCVSAVDFPYYSATYVEI